MLTQCSAQGMNNLIAQRLNNLVAGNRLYITVMSNWDVDEQLVVILPIGTMYKYLN